MKGTLNIVDAVRVEQLADSPPVAGREPSVGQWIRLLRTYLRMTQAELAQRAGIAQSHVAAIEKEKFEPGLKTIRCLFAAMDCDVMVRPIPRKPIKESLRGRARHVALQRLRRTMGTMALEQQAPERGMFRRLLEKRTDEILADKRERLRVRAHDPKPH